MRVHPLINLPHAGAERGRRHHVPVEQVAPSGFGRKQHRQRLAAAIHRLTHVPIPPPRPVEARAQTRPPPDLRSAHCRRPPARATRCGSRPRSRTRCSRPKRRIADAFCAADQTHELGLAHPFAAEIQHRRRPVRQNMHDPELHRPVQHQLDRLPVRRPGVDVHRRNCRHRFASVPRLHRTFALPHLRLSEHALPWAADLDNRISAADLDRRSSSRRTRTSNLAFMTQAPLLNPKRNG